MAKEFKLPDLGEGIVEAQIIRVLVQDGERVEEDQYLLEVETDKAAVEIPSPVAGVVQKVHAHPGDTINVGDVIVTFNDGAQTPSSAVASGATGSHNHKSVPRSASAGPSPVATVAAPPDSSNPRPTKAAASPAVRRRARELGVLLDDLAGSGPGGRITKVDVERAAAGVAASSRATSGVAQPSTASVASGETAPPLPGEPGEDAWGPIRREPINQIRKTIAAQMTRSAFTAVHVTHCDDADITELERVRHRLQSITGSDLRITIMSFVIRAVCLALKKHRIFNSSFDLDGGSVVYKDYINIGIAVDSSRGLVVPVIRNADRLSLSGIAASLRSLAEQIRGNRFAIEDLRGGTFTITNVGALGGGVNTPIINYPEVAILGLGRSRRVPVFRDGEVVEAIKLPANLSFDHRATDGANAARFLADIFSYLETPEKFLLD